MVDGELLDLGELVLQILQKRVAEGKLAFQGARQDTTQALEHRDGLIAVVGVLVPTLEFRATREPHSPLLRLGGIETVDRMCRQL